MNLENCRVTTRVTRWGMMTVNQLAMRRVNCWVTTRVNRQATAKVNCQAMTSVWELVSALLELEWVSELVSELVSEFVLLMR
jgi:hypothetical protein